MAGGTSGLPSWGRHHRRGHGAASPRQRHLGSAVRRREGSVGRRRRGSAAAAALLAWEVGNAGWGPAGSEDDPGIPQLRQGEEEEEAGTSAADQDR